MLLLDTTFAGRINFKFPSKCDPSTLPQKKETSSVQLCAKPVLDSNNATCTSSKNDLRFSLIKEFFKIKQTLCNKSLKKVGKTYTNKITSKNNDTKCATCPNIRSIRWHHNNHNDTTAKICASCYNFHRYRIIHMQRRTCSICYIQTHSVRLISTTEDKTKKICSNCLNGLKEKQATSQNTFSSRSDSQEPKDLDENYFSDKENAFEPNYPLYDKTAMEWSDFEIKAPSPLPYEEQPFPLPTIATQDEWNPSTCINVD